ncbi:Hypothetical_protein [Hexamita inflata]|uniref:Hypothetical_protein n=1 Tax=Hexamita inflata TaxID=28002 RepID=A0ABP1HLG3_9EUKA
MPLLAAAYQLLGTQRTVQTNLEISAGIGNKNSSLNFVAKKIVNSSLFSILQLGLSFPAWFIECNVSDIFSIALFSSPLRSLCVSYKWAQLDHIIGIILKLFELCGAKSCDLIIIQLLSNIASQNYLLVHAVNKFKRKNRFTKSCQINQRRVCGLVELVLMLYFEYQIILNIFGTSFLFVQVPNSKQTKWNIVGLDKLIDIVNYQLLTSGSHNISIQYPLTACIPLSNGGFHLMFVKWQNILTKYH